MKTFLMVLCACLVLCASPVSGNETDKLHIRIALTTGERSKDSRSNTTTITVERDTIVWQETSSRDSRMGKPPLRKTFTLPPADKENLLALIRSNNLLVSESLDLPQDTVTYGYFRISARLTVAEQKGAISISGMRTAVKIKEERLYQNTLTLVTELYGIMNRHDKSVRFEKLIHEPKRQ